MYILFFFVTKFFQYNNLLYKLFLFLYYWYSTKYWKTSCFQIFTLFCHIAINNFHWAQWEPHNLFKLEVIWMFMSNFACYFFTCLAYFTMEYESVRSFLCMSVWYLSFSMLYTNCNIWLNVLLIFWGHVLISDNLKLYKRILL